jgi:hypothetical protein
MDNGVLRPLSDLKGQVTTIHVAFIGFLISDRLVKFLHTFLTLLSFKGFTNATAEI